MTITRRQLRSIFSLLAVLGFGAYLAWADHQNRAQKSEPIPEGYVQVTHVVDGDTADVLINGKKETVRFLGINTPESVDPRRKVECFGKEASNHTKELLDGKVVRLEGDMSQDDRDTYDRLLRYVFLPDGTNVNEALVRDGYAHEYTYKKPGKYRDLLRVAEADARLAKRGLWADNTCAGKN